MKLVLIFLITFFFLGFSCVSPRAIEWNDASFEIGDYKKLFLRTDLDGPCTVKICDSVWDNNLTFDSLVGFLNQYPSVKINIESHYDYGSDKFAFQFSEWLANSTKAICLNRGIDSNRIQAHGFGRTQVLLSKDSISKMPKKEQWKGQYMNCRINMVISSK